METGFMKGRISKWKDYKILEAVSHTQVINLFRYANLMQVEFLN